MYDVTLNNGVKMPVIGLGIYKVTKAAELQSAVDWALEAGYRSFDTAQMYGNEAMLGQALKGKGMKRSHLFITSKVDTGNMGYQQTLDSFAQTLRDLQTDYLDLFLVHWPGQQKQRLLDTWKAMELLVREGKVRAIGVCNCLPRHLQWLLDNCQAIPAINQVEYNPLMNNKELTAWCKNHNIQMEAWRPLIKGNMGHPQITRLAEKYKKTPAQILLRWEIQTGYIVIPKSVHRERIFENIDIFDFQLEAEDVGSLDILNQDLRGSRDPETFDF